MNSSTLSSENLCVLLSLLSFLALFTEFHHCDQIRTLQSLRGPPMDRHLRWTPRCHTLEVQPEAKRQSVWTIPRRSKLGTSEHQLCQSSYVMSWSSVTGSHVMIMLSLHYGEPIFCLWSQHFGICHIFVLWTRAEETLLGHLADEWPSGLQSFADAFQMGNISWNFKLFNQKRITWLPLWHKTNLDVELLQQQEFVFSTSRNFAMCNVLFVIPILKAWKKSIKPQRIEK